MDVVAPDRPLSDGIVALRVWREDDAGELTEALDGDEEVTRWLDSIPQPYTDADARAWLSQIRESWANGAASPFAVVDASTGRLFGGIGIRWIDRVNHIGEVGYWAREDARGQGVTTRALRLVSDWALGAAGCGRLMLRADTENIPSQRVAERAGFVREGIERSARFSPRQGRRVDFVVYSRLPTD